MLKLNDLQNRVYSGRVCIGFECVIYDEQAKEKQFVAKFENNQSDSKEWKMQIVLDRTRDADHQVYSFGYIMPKNMLPLELIAATGLKYFQLYLKQEIQAKVAMDFELGKVLEGM